MSITDKDIHNESKGELAQDRTEWAQERTLLAKERTFSAWARTGLASVAAGFAIARLFGTVESDWVAIILGVILVFTGGLIFILGYLSYRKALKELEEQGIRGTPQWMITLVTVLLVISSILAMLLVYGG